MGTEVIIARSGVGKVNAAACAQTLIHKFNVDSIINTGVAGGLHPDVKVGDVVISTNVTHHDVSKNQMKKLFPFQEEFIASKELIELARKACNSNSSNIQAHEGRIVSGECFVEDSKLKAKLIDEYAPHCTEMEGAAIGHVAYINDIPFLLYDVFLTVQMMKLKFLMMISRKLLQIIAQKLLLRFLKIYLVKL